MRQTLPMFGDFRPPTSRIDYAGFSPDGAPGGQLGRLAGGFLAVGSAALSPNFLDLPGLGN